MSKESTGKRITDELRLFAADPYTGWVPTDKQQADLRAIADHIDAEHEKAMAAAALIAGVPMTDENMAEHGWVRMPKDADGVPIRIGDAMVLQHEAKEKPYVVQSFTWDGEDWYFTCDEGLFNACGWEHYHEPTVEDVLREFALRVAGKECMTARPDVIAEYAKCLRLAGDAE